MPCAGGCGGRVCKKGATCRPCRRKQADAKPPRVRVSENPWTEPELAVLVANASLTSRELTKLLPGRTSAAIGSIRAYRLKQPMVLNVPEVPPVKAPGDYLETLSHYITDDFELMGIWMKWNGYAAHRELSRDERGWVYLLCTAK